MASRKTDQKMPARKPTLVEPVIVAEFWKNRHGETVRVVLQTFKEHNLIDLRQYFTDKDGKLKPTAKGLSLVVRRLPDLLKAVTKANDKARDLGLLDGGDE